MEIIDLNTMAVPDSIGFLICFLTIVIALVALNITFNYFVINENIAINSTIRFCLVIATVAIITWGTAFICFKYVNNQIENSFEQTKVTTKIKDVNFISSGQNDLINIKSKDTKLPDASYIQAFPKNKLNKIFKDSEITYIYNPEYKIIRVLKVD